MRRKVPYYDDVDWFGPHFDGYMFTLPDGEPWRLHLTERISQRVVMTPRNEREVIPAVAVYLANKSLPSQSASEQVIVKIFMQIPNLMTSSRRMSQLNHESTVYSIQATDESPGYENEADTLEYLTDVGCTSTAKLLADFALPSKENPYVPGGFLYMIVMEKLPGKPLSEVWNTRNLSIGMQVLIQAKFLDAISEVDRCGIRHNDPQSRNILWDEEEHRCYVIDFEASERTSRLPGQRDINKSSEKIIYTHCALWGVVTEEMRRKHAPGT